MSLEQRGFRPKNEDELSEQEHRASEILGSEIIPPSIAESVRELSASELKERFPRRYEWYLQALRPAKPEMSAAESEHRKHENERAKTMLKALNNLDAFIASEYQGEIKDERHARQIEVFEDLRYFIEGGGTEGYVKLPTGAGKTVVFTRFVDALKMKTMVVVPKKILVNQTAETFDSFAPDTDYGRVYGEAKEYDHDVTIITYDSLVNGVKDGTIDPAEYECLILDEAHRALSTERDPTIRKFESSLKIGFTATPEFNEQKKVANLLGAEIHRMDLKEAAAAGIVASFQSGVVRTGVRIGAAEMTDEAQLEQAVNVEARNSVAVNMYAERYAEKTGVFYCVGISHAERIVEMLGEKDVPAAVIHGGMTEDEQTVLLDKYNSGEIRVLANADLLIEGFDEPRASVCMNLRPTASKVVAEQRGGRVLRLDKEDPEKLAVVIDFLDEYTEKDGRFAPIIFAQVAEAASAMADEVRVAVERKLEEADEREAPAESGEFEIMRAEKEGPPSLSGYEIVWDEQKVMEIANESKLRDAERLPDGFVRASTLGQRLGKPQKFVDQVIGAMLKRFTLKMSDFELQGEGETWYLGPDSIDKVRKAMEPPEGFSALSLVEARLGIKNSDETELHSVFMQVMRIDHPEWFHRAYAQDNKGNLVTTEMVSGEILASPEMAEFRNELELSRNGLRNERAVREARNMFENLIGEKDVEEDARLAIRELVELGEKPRIRVAPERAEEMRLKGFLRGANEMMSVTLGPAKEALPAGMVEIELDVPAARVRPVFVKGEFRGGIAIVGSAAPDQVRVLPSSELPKKAA